ncbi:ABC transporter permease/M1 family aminopeptidase [Sphingobacterium hungaricum]
MFSTIYFFELKRWFKNPAFYIYVALFFSLSLFIVASSLGVFDGVTASTSGMTTINSAINIAGILNSLSMFIYFLLPTIIGASVYRDFQYNVHSYLYSYPITKLSYLSAKFLSALTIITLVSLSLGLGFYVAQYLPNVNQNLLGPNNIMAYLQPFIYFIIPNYILFGAIIFALVTFTRNVYSGVIFVLFLFVLQTFLNMLTSNMDNRDLAALVDPFGFEALSHYTKYWTIDEQNNSNLPFTGVILNNRLIWMGVAVVILALFYKSFSFNYQTFSFRKKGEGKRLTKNNFGSIINVNLPKVNFDYSFLSRLKTAWSLSNYDFKYIVKNWTFIIIMIVTVLMALVVASFSGQIYGTEIYPMTWNVLDTLGNIYGFFLQILIFLFAGMLIQRARMANMSNLVDATAIPNWTLLFSKFIALVKMTLLVLLISMLTGIIYQAYQGYYHFEIMHYITELFGLKMLNYLVLIFFAIFVQSFFKNYFVGFFACLVVFLIIPFLSRIGIEQSIYKFNQGPSFSYSDMNGYGDVRHYLYYKLYWLLLCVVLYIITLLFWKRGVVQGFKEKFANAKARFMPAIATAIIVFLLAFVGLGYAIYYQKNVKETFVSQNETEKITVDYEKKYKKYSKLPMPRIVDVKVDMNIYPKERNYDATVHYQTVNKTGKTIDTLFLSYSDELQTLDISGGFKEVIRDTVTDIRVLALNTTLQPLDTLHITSTYKNKPNNFLYDVSPILENGTFINNMMFLSIGYNDGGELVDNKIREKYNLPDRDRMPDPTDSLALQNTYISQDADWINFETTVSTSDDQIAIAPGYLQKEWEKDGRRYFHYKMDKEILNFYSFMSARYEVLKDKENGVNLEIYYHKGHEFNLERMMKSMKASLAYYGSSFSPYQFDQMRIIEFPLTHGTFAQAFANTVPFSEGIGFIANVDDEDPNKLDYPYSVISHEFAHQWWAHQVIGAAVKGATMLSESLSEYSSLKVLEKTYGQDQMRKFLKEALDSYLMGRTSEILKENPLMYNENQQYIHYNKGSLVMYAMSDFMGETVFNNFLKEYVQRTAFQYPPYTTSIEFVDLLKSRTPDSLQYLIKDMYETITLYDNAVESVTYKKINDKKYQVDITYKVSKYRTDDMGKRSYEDKKGEGLTQKIGKSEVKSLPLNDYVEIGIFGKQKDKGKFKVDNQIYLAKQKINKIENKITLFVTEEPVEVGVDPYNKLIDTDSNDNRKTVL